MAVVLPVLGLAGKLKNVQLKTLMNVKPYKLDAMSQVLFVSTCQNIHAAAVEVRQAAAAYGLTQARLDAMSGLITSYSAQVPEIRLQGGEINTSKSDIERLADDAKAILKDQLDPMVEGLFPTDPSAVELWRNARVVVDPTSTPTQAKYKVFTVDNGVQVLIEAAPITAIGKITYTATSNELGEAIMKPVKFGTYDIRVEMPGFLPFLLKGYQMKRGKINKVDIVLVRAT